MIKHTFNKLYLNLFIAIAYSCSAQETAIQYANEIKQEDLHIYLILLKFAIMHGKKTKIYTIQSQIKNHIQLLNLLKCLNQK